jgi:hypothetical protein
MAAPISNPLAAIRRPRRPEGPLPADKSQWYQLGDHLRSNHHPFAFHDQVLYWLPAEQQPFSSLMSFSRTGVWLATLPEMQTIPHSVVHALEELVKNTSLSHRPDQIDLRLVYAHALALINSTLAQPQLYAEFRARLAIFFDYIATLPLRP